MKRLAIASMFLLLFPFFARAAEPIFLSEIAWAGSSVSTADEWLEICGPTGTDLSGWIIEGAAAHGLALPDGSVIPSSGAFMIANYASDDPKSTLASVPDFITTSIALSNASLFLILRDATGVMIDSAGASGTAPLAGTSGSAKASMERALPLQDGSLASAWLTASLRNGFDPGATEFGTPGICPSLAITETPAAPTENASATPIVVVNPATPINPPQASASAIRISEIYPSPLSGEQEWIELTNPSGLGELLEGWTLEDGKGTATRLSGGLLPWGRIVITAPKGSLNNDGDLVVLKDAQGRILDGVAYGAWDTALYPRVGDVGKGMSVMRLELQDAFDVTTFSTPGTANVLVKKVVEENTSSLATSSDSLPSRPERSGVEESIRPETDPSTALGTTHVSVRSAQDDKKEIGPKKPLTIVKASAKPVAKKPTATRYKGSAYAAAIAVPPGVYSKTKMYVLLAGDVREVRLSKSSSEGFISGQKISFVAQAKEENGIAFLLANPNSISRIGDAASNTFATVEAWPETSGAYHFEAEVVALRTGGLEVRLAGVEGDVLLPSAMPGLKPGDRIAIEGFVAPGTRPRIVVPNAASIRLLKTMPVELTQRDLPLQRLPWPLMMGLTSAAIGCGLIAYLRSERLKRLALMTQPIEEDFS